MGYRPHICKKRVIEYFDATPNFNHMNQQLEEWLTDNGVELVGSEDGSDQWEIPKKDLREIPESAYESSDIPKEDLKSIVQSMLDAPTGDYAYIDWF